MKHFLAILGLTALVWLAVAMSEYHEYPLHVKVEMKGYDTDRYAVLSADTALAISLEFSGFNAFWLGVRNKEVKLSLDMHSELVHKYSRWRDGRQELCRTVAVDDLDEMLREQLDGYGIRNLNSSRDSLQLLLVERSHKVLRPSIDSLSFSFADGYGLYGEPIVSPREVTLYGTEEALAQINELNVKPLNITGIDGSRRYRLVLEPVWKEFGDVYVSSEYLTLTLPVERFVEREYSLPVTVEGADTTVNLRIYPDHVNVRVWVAQKDIPSVSADRFLLVANYRDILNGSQRLKLRLARFPEGVRIRSFSSDEVQYVIIK